MRSHPILQLMVARFVVLTALAATGCTGAGGSTHAYSLSGVAQKGPFVLGSRVEVAELDPTLAPTGRTFTTQIIDDSGAFSLPNVQLGSAFVSLTANGFYFDEVAGSLSVAEIQLGAVADVTNLSTVNANLLSELERDRVVKLIADGSSLADAKKQAQRELLTLFGVTGDLAPAETLSIANGSPDDTALLAVSVILQSTRTPAQLTEFLAQMSADFAPDGKLDDNSLGVKLAVGAELVDLAAVRANLMARYQQLGSSATIGDFESVVRNFIATTPFLPAGTITYPDAGAGGPNILSPSVTTLTASATATVSVAADVPVGRSVRVRLTATGNLFLSAASDPANWEVASATSSEQLLELTAQPSETTSLRDTTVNCADDFPGAKSLHVDIFENGATSPTSTKTVSFM